MSTTAGTPDSALIDDLVAANLILCDQGVVDAFGHISVRHDRNPAHYLMARSIAPALVTPDDIMEFDGDSEPVDRRGRKVYVERFIHSEIYRARPDVVAVIHSHSPTVLPFSVSTLKMQPLAQVSGHLGTGVPVFDTRDLGITENLLVRDAPMGKALAGVLGGHAVVLMRGHGSATVGKNIRQAVWRAIYTEINARQQAIALQFGPVNYLTAAEAKFGADHVPVDDDRAWDHWRRHAFQTFGRSASKGPV